MSGSSRSRPKPKPKLEPISLEELAGTTGMSGFGTIFTRDLSQNVPVLDRLDSLISSAPESIPDQSGAPELPAPECSAVEISAPDKESSALLPNAILSSAPLLSVPGALETALPETPALNRSAAEPPPVVNYDESALERSALDAAAYRKPRIRRADTVAEGHSLAEQAVYELMYREGKIFQGDNRILTTGLRTLAERVRLAYANCKANVRSLISKRAIAEYGSGFSYTVGRTYIIYSPEEIMRRRREAGLTHVIRTRGVAFVDPRTGRMLRDSSAPDSTAPETSEL